MNLSVAYLGRSRIWTGPAGVALSLEPNLRRDRVSYVGTLHQPLRFREAVSALHDVVVSDLRFQPKDHSDFKEYLARMKEREDALRRGAAQQARAAILGADNAVAAQKLEPTFNRLRGVYWSARLKYSNYLSYNDPELWRMLVPCDPVITVAPDVLFFECFSKDESSYGCLTVDRSAFSKEENVALGTTNVDYSWALYEEFQKLRSYRETRFQVDPKGFEVATEGAADYREEKIDLPPSWLRGFMQLQSAMSLPLRRVPVSREGLYNVLAWLKRHRAQKSPRAVRFELEPGKPATLVLEPWEKRIVLHGTPYPGLRAEVIRTWGRDRLRVLARLLPLAEGADVFLMGTGLPSFWSVRMGEMRLLLGLSGWTVNDWTGGSALDQIAPPLDPSTDLLGDVAATFQDSPTRTFEEVRCTDRGVGAVRGGGAEPAGADGPADPRPAGGRLPLAADHAGGAGPERGRPGESRDRGRSGTGRRGVRELDARRALANGAAHPGRGGGQHEPAVGVHRPAPQGGGGERTGRGGAGRRWPNPARQVRLRLPPRGGPAARTVPAPASAAAHCAGRAAGAEDAGELV